MAKSFNYSDYLSDLESKLPELATSADLVRLGVFASEAAVSKARKLGHSPDYIQFSPGRIRYPRAAVINFFIERTKCGAKGKCHSCSSNQLGKTSQNNKEK
ncbi:MAG: hypothetical protein BGO10_01340 [Chlamydia sp. 32-24]|nr:MAG: hypothetical protein BGO10_01340 [Chlamydia sp. 32-24]